MAALVIHAPQDKADKESKRSFEQTLKSKIGDGYAITKSLYVQITPGSNVVLLDKARKLRAEGKLVQLEPREKTGNGIQRYDVKLDNLRIVPYKSERLNRNGVAVV